MSAPTPKAPARGVQVPRRPAAGPALAPVAQAKNPPVFGKRNFMGLGLGVAVLLVGFIALASEKFIDARQFSVSLHVAPPLILLGYGIMGWAILRNPKPTSPAPSSKA